MQNIEVEKAKLKGWKRLIADIKSIFAIIIDSIVILCYNSNEA